MMANTHALDLAGVAKDHWLRSDIWLPNGWATVVFVVLSGYGVGYIYSVRLPESVRNAALRRRAREILAVMFGSNYAFAALRQYAGGETSVLTDIEWWLGFFTMESPWTISGVLLPTTLVLLVAPSVMRLFRFGPWLTLFAILSAQVVVGALTTEARQSSWASDSIVRFLLLDGFGGFPVLSFLNNGMLGIWVGLAHRTELLRWRTILGILAALQLIAYISTFLPPLPILSVMRSTIGPVGKFGWIFVIANLLTFSAPIGKVLALIGRFALGSFVMHRVFLQALSIVLGYYGSTLFVPGIVRYGLLLAGTLILTWVLCFTRQEWRWVDAPFRKFAM